MYQSKKILVFWSVISTTICILNIFLFKKDIVGTLSFAVYILCLSSWIGALLPVYMGEQGRKIWGLLLMVCLISFLNVLFYYPYKITQITSSIILIFPLALFFFKQREEVPTQKDEEYFERSFALHTLIFILLEITLVFLIFKNQTMDVLQSPWNLLNKNFFIIYAGATALLFWIINNTKRTTSDILLTSIHLFITYSIAPIIYKIGYGYDGFIHRATEVWIKTNGFILPKEPFYIGQYGLVVWLSHITNVSIHYIDIYLVPILASIFIPFVIYYTVKNSWKLHGDTSLLLIWILPFLFFTSLHLTTPHNVVLLLLILCIFTTLGYIYRNLPILIPIAISIMAFVTHPLLGVSMFIFVIMTILIKSFKHTFLKWFGIIVLICILALIPSTLFTLQLVLNGHDFPQLTNPLMHLDKMIDIFRRPYWYKQTDSVMLETVYHWQRLIVPTAILFAIIGFFAKKQKAITDFILPATTIGFWTSAWLLRTWIIFPDVIGAEQADYPLRLLVGGLLFILPWSMYGAYILGNVILKKFNYRAYAKNILILIAAFFLMISLYLSYPQNNPKVFFPGFNVTQYDLQAITWIHNDNTQYDYVVLSNPITAVAALEKYSFAKYLDTQKGELFYYSIPSGGPLYGYYQQMLYKGQKREYMDELMKFTNTEKSYFVVNSYWAKFNEIVEGAKKTADSWQVITNKEGQDKIYIFTYGK